MSQNLHRSVLLNELVDNIITETNGIYFDATFGRGGHTEYLLNRLGKKGKIIACDLDSKAIEFGKERFKNVKNLIFYHTNFANIEIIAKLENIEYFHGIMADLGVSSPQYDDVDYGFTFREKSLLDLRFDINNNKQTAADVLNNLKIDEIARIIYEFGEDKNAKKIAKEIDKFRQTNKIIYTTDLVNIISNIVPPNFINKTLKRVFQALRIFVNSELDVLKKFIEKSFSMLKPGGRLGIITFHSLEDRIVKEAFNLAAKGCICPPTYPVCVCDKKSIVKIITKKPITPNTDEIKNNFRARSAKLRVVEKI